MGVFDPEVARRYDRIFEAAERHGIYVVLTLFAVGFSPPSDPFKSWEDNPYHIENGGPARTRFAFFDEPRVRKAAKGRVRYAARRFGAYTSLLAVDLIHEPEWDGEIGEDSWRPWAGKMARAWDGAAWGSEPKPLYDHAHVGIRSATFSGAGVLAHSAPPFNIDSDEPLTPTRATSQPSRASPTGPGISARSNPGCGLCEASRAPASDG